MKTRNKSILSLKDNKNKSLSKSKKTKIVKRKETIKDASYRDQHNIGRRKSTSSVVTYSLDSRLFFDVYAKFNNENLPKDRNIYNGICSSSSVNKMNIVKKSPNSKIKPLSVVTTKRQISSEDESCSSDTNSEVSKKRKVNKVSYEAKPINSDEACIPSPQIPLVSPIKNNNVNKIIHSNENRVIATRNFKPVNPVIEKNTKNEVKLKPTTKNETFQRLLDNKTVFKKHLSQNLTEKTRSVRKPIQPVLSPPSPSNTRRLSSRLNKPQNDADSTLQSNDEQSISSNPNQKRSNKKKDSNKIDSDPSPPKRGKRIASLNAAAIINCVQNLFNESPKRSSIKSNKRRTSKTSDVNQTLTAKDNEAKRENPEQSNSKINNYNITFEDIPLDNNCADENNSAKKMKSREKTIKKQPERSVKKSEEKIAQSPEEKPSKKIEEKIGKKPEEKSINNNNRIEENCEKKPLRKAVDEKVKKSEQIPIENGEHLPVERNAKRNESKEINLSKINEEKSVKEVEEEIKIEKSSKKSDEKMLGEKEKSTETDNLVEKSKGIVVDIKRSPPTLMKSQKRNINNISRFFDITTKSNSKQKDVGLHAAPINRKPKTFTVERVVKKRLKNVDECFEEFAKSSGMKKGKKNQHDKQVAISVEEEEDNGESFWEWEGESIRKPIQLQLAGEFVDRTCYRAIRHTRDDVIIRTLDCVMLRSSADQEPFLAKIIVFYLDEETGKKMMTLLWYYRPEHTEQGRLEWHTESDVYASRHLDNNSVDCIEDKAFVLPVEIYSRFMAFQKRQSAGTRPCLAARLIPVNNDESITSEFDENKLDNCTDMFVSNWYYTLNFQNAFPSEMTNSNVFVCRGLYDINQHKITRNILQNIQSPKLEPIDPCDSVDSAMSISSCESEHKMLELTVEVPSIVMATEVETPLSDIPIPPTKTETVSNNCLPPISSFQHILPKPQTDTTVPVIKSCPPPPPSKPIQPPLPNTTNGDVTDCPKQPNGHP